MRACIAAFITGAVFAATTPPAAGQRADARVRVGVFVTGADRPVSPSRQATLLLTLERALEANPRLTVVDKDRILAERAGVIPADVVSEARGLLESGEALLRRQRPKLALVRLQAAVRQLEASLAWVKKQQLARAQFLVGVAHAVLGHDDRARARFVELQIWRPDYTVDTSLQPSLVLPLWESARAQVAELPGGSLEILSRPGRALAYVDGRFVGFTPTTVEGLTEGAHYVTLRKIGYRRAVVRSVVSGKVEERVRADLARSKGADDVSELVASANRRLGESRAPPSVAGLVDIFAIRHALFLRAPERGETRYELFVYDTRTRKLVARASARTTDERGVEEVFPELARAAYGQISFAPPAPREKARKPARRAGPFYTRWWFWTGLGLAAAGAAVPFLLPDSDPSPSCPTGSVCGEIVLTF